jgi:glycosyltransferase involved in cell wall biosynthesis
VSWTVSHRDAPRPGLRVLIELNDADLRLGAVNDALDLAELTAASGTRFLVCGPLTDELCAEAARRGIATSRAASVAFSRRGIVAYAADVVRWTARLVRWRPDIVHLNYACYGPSLACAAWLSGIPVVARAGGPYLPGNPSNRWVAAYLANCRAHADLLLASPIRDRVAVTGDLYRPDRLRSTMARQRPLPPKTAGVVRLVYLGQLVERKGLHLLIDALAQTQSACDVLLAGGDWSAPGYPQRIKDMVLSAGLSSRVRFENHRQDVGAVLSTADIFVLPSLSEARPRTIIEAMSLGVPVVASDAGGIPSLITDGQTGLLARTGDAASLARAIDRLVRSAGLRQRLGEAGRAYAVRECRADRTAAAYLAVYDRVITERRGTIRRRPALEATEVTTWPT